uniref:Uncharacterized protein n=1 Tax=Anguilla anguilla TaxID=7936 RepID=A0A0E9PB15_ANGAN
MYIIYTHTYICIIYIRIIFNVGIFIHLFNIIIQIAHINIQQGLRQ